MKYNLFFLILLFPSCRELVQDEFPALKPVPVVYSILEEGKPLRVLLTWTASLDTSCLQPVDHAAIQLFADGQYVETLADDGKGFYSAATVVAPSVRYRCVVDVPGEQTVIASDSLPTVVVPADIRYIPVAGRDEEGLAYPALRFTIPNRPGERRYYEAKIWEIQYNRVPAGKPVKNAVQPGPVTDPVLQSEGLPINVFSNEKMKDNSYTMTINYHDGNYGNSGRQPVPVVLELRAVSDHYYCYLKQRYLYEQGFRPEFGKTSPPANLYSNAENGYGIFAGYAASISDTLNLE